MKKVIGIPEIFVEKMLVLFVLDNSSAMRGKDIEELNREMKRFLNEIRNDDKLAVSLDVGIVVFNSNVQVVQEPALVDDIEYVDLDGKGGSSSFHAVIQKVLELNDMQKRKYKENGIPYKRSSLFFISNGMFLENNIHENSCVIKEDVKSDISHLIILGTTEADVQQLDRIVHIGKGGILHHHITYMMDNVNMKQFFQWTIGTQCMNAKAPGLELEIGSVEVLKDFKVL